ncbi:MAG: Unknown protein [uncultured Sulfurovum sp.]|uniref:Uncharacterized protein n=1 Tax=uncultured Sulfurovum sp. TaxID=269237 RepID=A0A6S6U683_9BACT|nr:MAG: Unknown protein [uncultured Sulfurovum sp.]
MMGTHKVHAKRVLSLTPKIESTIKLDKFTKLIVISMKTP